jgi:hypothetical protein
MADAIFHCHCERSEATSIVVGIAALAMTGERAAFPVMAEIL